MDKRDSDSQTKNIKCSGKNFFMTMHKLLPTLTPPMQPPRLATILAYIHHIIMVNNN